MKYLVASTFEGGYQPLNAISATTALLDADIEAQLIDIYVEGLSLERFSDADLVFICVPLFDSLTAGTQLAKQLKEAKPSQKICFFGQYATINAKSLASEYGDYAIAGEWEKPIVSLAKHLSGEQGQDLRGVIDRTRGLSSEIVVPQLIRDGFRLPRRDLAPPLHKYPQPQLEKLLGEKKVVGGVEGSRGCHHKCSYCSVYAAYDGKVLLVSDDLVERDVAINVRYPREWRDSLGALEQLPIYTPLGSQITLGTVAKVKVSDGPPMLKSENARPSGWVYIDVRGRDIASVVADLRRVVNEQVKLQPGMSLSFSGQFEFLERANARLKLVVPATLLIIFVLLYLTFARFDEALLIMATLPFALTGGAWFLYLLGFNLSVATGVGFIALAGVSAEFGVIMLLYLKNAWAEREDLGDSTERGLVAAIREGAVQRVRPKAMTVAVIIAGLLPILLGSGTGSEVMSRIAAPMVGGMVTAPLLSLFVIPAAYRLMRRRNLLNETVTLEGKIV